MTRNAKALQAKARKMEVTPLSQDTYSVKSPSGKTYTVRLIKSLEGGMCNCQWGQYRKADDAHRSGCSHVLGVYAQLEDSQGRKAFAHNDMSQAQRQHRPITRIGDGVILTSRKQSTLRD